MCLWRGGGRGEAECVCIWWHLANYFPSKLKSSLPLPPTGDEAGGTGFTILKEVSLNNKREIILGYETKQPDTQLENFQKMKTTAYRSLMKCHARLQKIALGKNVFTKKSFYLKKKLLNSPIQPRCMRRWVSSNVAFFPFPSFPPPPPLSQVRKLLSLAAFFSKFQKVFCHFSFSPFAAL